MIRAISRAVEFRSNIFRNVHTTAVRRLREIVVEKSDENTTVIKCNYVKSSREPYVLKFKEKSAQCVLCRLKLNLQHTDVLILSQFIDTKGHVFQYKDTNLCWEQYKLVKELVYMAQHAGLLPEPVGEEPKKPYQLLNTYYDETTINLRPKRKYHNKRFFYLKEKLAPIEKLRVKPEVGPHYGPTLY